MKIKTTPSTAAAYIAQMNARRDAALLAGDTRYAAQMQRAVERTVEAVDAGLVVA